MSGTKKKRRMGEWEQRDRDSAHPRRTYIEATDRTLSAFGKLPVERKTLRFSSSPLSQRKISDPAGYIIASSFFTPRLSSLCCLTFWLFCPTLAPLPFNFAHFLAAFSFDRSSCSLFRLLSLLLFTLFFFTWSRSRRTLRVFLLIVFLALFRRVISFYYLFFYSFSSALGYSIHLSIQYFNRAINKWLTLPFF